MTTPRLLVVDDSEMNLELATHVLDGEGFEVQVANSAVEALQRVAVFRPDAIVMDIQMPGMDGLALSRLLKDAPETRHIVIIAFTAYAMKGDEAKMRAGGCDGYLAKPIDVATFAESVRGFLADHA